MKTLASQVKKCMTDPIYDIEQNFSIEKSREFYDKRVQEWEKGMYSCNPAVKVETETFPFTDLQEMTRASAEAMLFLDNIKKMGHVREVEWSIYGQNIVVDWYRLKTFSEWVVEGLRDALVQAYKFPEGGVKRILERELGEGYYENTDIHLFAEGKIDEETLKRLSKYEPYQPIEGRDIDADIKECLKNMGVDIDDVTAKDVEILTLKVDGNE